MLEIASTIIGVTLTGITLIAYKHPRGYARLFNYLMGVLMFTYAALAGWYLGSDYTLRVLIQYVPADKMKGAIDAVAATGIGMWGAIGMIAIGAYLAFLNFLPRFMDDERQHEDTKK